MFMPLIIAFLRLINLFKQCSVITNPSFYQNKADFEASDADESGEIHNPRRVRHFQLHVRATMLCSASAGGMRSESISGDRDGILDCCWQWRTETVLPWSRNPSI